jgi:hypothetical protein
MENSKTNSPLIKPRTAVDDRNELIAIFCEFIRETGIGVEEGKVEGKTFVPGLVIRDGVLIFEREKLLYPGDMLHEAGHIAVVPSGERKKLNDNILTDRPGKSGDECAAMLWSYAACIRLRISPRIVFHEHGYKGDSDWLLENYGNGQFIGIPLLEWMGMASSKKGAGGFPEMVKWLRD